MKHIVFLFLTVILINGTLPSNAYERPGLEELQTTREEVLASRKRRSEQLEKMLADAQERMNDHNNNVKLLTDDEKQKLAKKIDAFSKKLEQMSREPDEREIERIIQRERLIKERQAERRQMREEL